MQNQLETKKKESVDENSKHLEFTEKINNLNKIIDDLKTKQVFRFRLILRCYRGCNNSFRLIIICKFYKCCHNYYMSINSFFKYV